MWGLNISLLIYFASVTFALSHQGYHHTDDTNKRNDVETFHLPSHSDDTFRVARFNIPKRKPDEGLKLAESVASPEQITIVKKSTSLLDAELPGAIGEDDELSYMVEGSGSGSGHHGVSDIMRAARTAKKTIEKNKELSKVEKEEFPGLPESSQMKVSVDSTNDSAEDTEEKAADEDLTEDKINEKSAAIVEKARAASNEAKKTEDLKKGKKLYEDDDDPTKDPEVEEAQTEPVAEEKSTETEEKSPETDENFTATDDESKENVDSTNDAGKFGNDFVPKPGINPTAAFKTAMDSIKPIIKSKKKNKKEKKKKSSKRKNNQSVKVELSVKSNAIDKIKIGYVDFLKKHLNGKKQHGKPMTAKKDAAHHVKGSVKDVTESQKKKDGDLMSQIKNIAKQIDAVEKKNAEEKKKLLELKELKIMKNAKKHELVEDDDQSKVTGSGSVEDVFEGSAEEIEVKEEIRKRKHKKQVKKLVKKMEADINEFVKSKNMSVSRVKQNKNKLFGMEDDLNNSTAISRSDDTSPDNFECPWVCFWTCHSYCPKECCHNPYGCNQRCKTFCTPYCSDRCCAPGSRRLPKLKLSFPTPVRNKTALEIKVEKQRKLLEDNTSPAVAGQGEAEAVRQAESYAAELLGISRECPLFCNKICAPGLCAQDCCEKSTILSYLNQEKNLLAEAMKYKKQLAMLPKDQLDALLAQSYGKELGMGPSQLPLDFTGLEGADDINEKQAIATQAAPLAPTAVANSATNAQHTHPKPSAAPVAVQTVAALAPQTAKPVTVAHVATHARTAPQLVPVAQTPAPKTGAPLHTQPARTPPARTAPVHTPAVHTLPARTAPPVVTAPAMTAPPVTAAALPPQPPPEAAAAPPLPQQQAVPAPVPVAARPRPANAKAPAPVAAQFLGQEHVTEAEITQPVPPQLSALFPFLNLPHESTDVANAKSNPQPAAAANVKPPYPNVKAPSIANKIAPEQQKHLPQANYYRPTPAPPQVPQAPAVAAAAPTPIPVAHQQVVAAAPQPAGQYHVSAVASAAVHPPPPPPVAAPPAAHFRPAPPANAPPALPQEQQHAAAASFQQPAGMPPKHQEVFIEKAKPVQVGGFLLTPEVTIADPNDPVPPGYQVTKIDPRTGEATEEDPTVAAAAPPVVPQAPPAAALAPVPPHIQGGKPVSLPNQQAPYCPTPVNCPEGGIVDPDYCPPICRTSCIEQCPNECCPNYGNTSSSETK